MQQTHRQPIDETRRYPVRYIDPTTSLRPSGRRGPEPTAYRADALLVTADSKEGAYATLATIDHVVREFGLRRTGNPFEPNDRDPESGRRASILNSAVENRVPLVFPCMIEPETDSPARPVDAFEVQQRLLSVSGPAANDSVGLDHMMYAATINNPFWVGNQFAELAGSRSDTETSPGIHTPVALVMATPQPRSVAWRPHVVVMDTGVGNHAWFAGPNESVQRQMYLANGVRIGVDVNLPESMETDPESAGAVSNPMTGSLASHAGHGTFIVGLIRQTCPEALITALRVVGNDGIVAEDVLDTELTALAVHQRQNPGATDALVLSLGYYAEIPDNETYTAGIHRLLVDLARHGVTTFASAGNDSTDRKWYPAAFATQPPFDGTDICALVSVAALNPDGTIALFSNDGDWVTAHASGANLVSTVPTTMLGGIRASSSLIDPKGLTRSTIDPERYSGGFALGSGASFAAPVIAGHFLAELAASEPIVDVAQRARIAARLRRSAR